MPRRLSPEENPNGLPEAHGKLDQREKARVAPASLDALEVFDADVAHFGSLFLRESLPKAQVAHLLAESLALLEKAAAETIVRRTRLHSTPGNLGKFMRLQHLR